LARRLGAKTSLRDLGGYPQIALTAAVACGEAVESGTFRQYETVSAGKLMQFTLGMVRIESGEFVIISVCGPDDD